MYFAEVIGHVVATTKNENLVGKKLLIVQPLNNNFEPYGEAIVAIDTVGAGFSDRVLLATGSSARVIFDEKAPVDAAIIAIIDTLERH